MDSETLKLFPALEMEELNYVSGMIKEMDPDQKSTFASIYMTRRKDPQLLLLLALVGFLGFAGIHRFIIGQVGMGILYLLTAGLCFIGTIIDLVNYKTLAFEYNQKMAQEAFSIVTN